MATARKPHRPQLTLTVLEDRTVPAAIGGVLDFGFETAGVATYRYNPAGSPWAFTGQAGLTANNTAFTAANPGAPQGGQVAFVQGRGSVSQTMTLAAGTYVLSFSAAQRGSQAQTFNVLVDGKVVGTFNGLTGTAYNTLTTSSFTLAAGAHTIAIQGTNLAGGDSTVLIDQVSIVQQPTGLADSGFEAAVMPGNGFDYSPDGSTWTFAGQAGVSANGTDFTSGNPVAPQGEQVAFIQETGSVTQAVTFAAGTYALTFNAAQRGNGGNAQTLNVLVDGNVVGTFNSLAGAGYATLTTNTFAVTAGSHTVSFQGTNQNGGDSTMFIDQVALTQVSTRLGDGGFEVFGLGTGGFQYNPAGSAWAFAGTAGVTGNGSRFTSSNANAPQGTLVAFIQGTGVISQAMPFAAGTYTLTFSAAQRGNLASGETFQVLVDGGIVGTFNSLTGSAYSPLATSSFTVSAGTHTVTIQGTNLKGGDNTVFLDNMVVNQQPNGLADNGFEWPAQAAGGYKYNPTGAAWSFSGHSGVTSNGSGFTNANANAPQGSQVAFLQNKSSISQTATFTAGNYKVNFNAAQRANAASLQSLQVLVDGTVVGTFNTLKGSAYTPLMTAAFPLTAGNHIITFQGTNQTGDNTVFIDQVTVNSV